MRFWLGNLLAVALVFSQSTLLWANLEAPVQAQAVVQHDCHSQHTQMETHQKHCQQDCCKHGKLCTTACLHCVVSGTASVLPISVSVLLPHFRASSLVATLSRAPDGTETNLIYRPPQALF